MAVDLNQILQRYNKSPTRLMDILHDVQMADGYISSEAIDTIAEATGLSRVDVEQTVSFYHFFARQPQGRYSVYLNNNIISYMNGRADVVKAFEQEAGCRFGTVSRDGLIGLFTTACIGMNDQEPAAIINNAVFTRLTPEKVKGVVAGMRAGKNVDTLVKEFGEVGNGNAKLVTMVQNNIQQKGEVVFADFSPGSALKKAVEQSSEQVIAEVKNSNLRGRGGAGFPTGMKWEFCRKSAGDEKYVMCNADEGEPGTFKDRVILTEAPQLLFEGMAIAGYAIGAREGILYLRAEYRYLQRYLESVLDEYRSKNLLGKNILGKSGLDFDIRIQFGAGAYVCGEESALIESAEGKRGEPRIRPPFPVEKGYLNKPTSVNNVETFCAAARIMVNGAQWFKAIGSKDSAGTKVLSISGDCNKPGVYEVPWGMSIQELLTMVDAKDTMAVQVGGPSGVCIAPDQFTRKICYGDCATGGSIMIFNKQRNLFDIVANFMDFFIDESCGSCISCRAGNVIVRNTLQKIISGNGVAADLDLLLELGTIMKTANRCGLGQSSANPVITTIQNFRSEYDKKLRNDTDYATEFDMAAAVAESCEYVNRKPNL